MHQELTCIKKCGTRTDQNWVFSAAQFLVWPDCLLLFLKILWRQATRAANVGSPARGLGCKDICGSTPPSLLRADLVQRPRGDDLNNTIRRPNNTKQLCLSLVEGQLQDRH